MAGKLPAQLADSLLDNAGRRLAIRHERLQPPSALLSTTSTGTQSAVWTTYAAALSFGDQPVADKRLMRDSIDALHDGRMYLPGLDQRPRHALGIDSSQCLGEELTITQYGLLVVF